MPRAWWESRVTYTRSVAVNSMVGYVVGLGDRHSSNILLDKTSAEMIHIDLGVAFEQGKCLKTPETVPFRLTRDVVDGFGACGVEGIMRKCSEETLRVLRANKNALTTVVAVLVHDPILKWAVSPERAAGASARWRRRRAGRAPRSGSAGGAGENGRRGKPRRRRGSYASPPSWTGTRAPSSGPWPGRCSSSCRTRRTRTCCARCTQGGRRGCDTSSDGGARSSFGT